MLLKYNTYGIDGNWNNMNIIELLYGLLIIPSYTQNEVCCYKYDKM